MTEQTTKPELKVVLNNAGAPLDQPETPARGGAPTPRKQPTQADLRSLEDKLQMKANWDAFDLRGAAALNLMRIAMNQGCRFDVAASDMAHFRNVMAIAGLWVVGEPNADIPSGFGEPVRVEMAQQLKDALAAVVAAVQAPPDGQGEAT